MEPSGQICCLRIRSIQEDQTVDQNTTQIFCSDHYGSVIPVVVAAAVSALESVKTVGRFGIRTDIVVRCLSVAAIRSTPSTKGMLDTRGNQRTN